MMSQILRRQFNETYVINEVRASVWRPRTLRALSRYDVIKPTEMTTEFSLLRTAAFGLKPSTSSLAEAMERAEGAVEFVLMKKGQQRKKSTQRQQD